MLTIYKYRLPPIVAPTLVRIPMPRGAVPFFVGNQNGLTLWARVSTDNPIVERDFAVVATGQDLTYEKTGIYIGSAICGDYVWHVHDTGREISWP